MAQINCKCGEPLTIEPGASHISCPACKAIFRVRSAAPAPVAVPPPAAETAVAPAPVVRPSAPPAVPAKPRAPAASSNVMRPPVRPTRPPTAAPKIAPPPVSIEQEFKVPDSPEHQDGGAEATPVGPEEIAALAAAMEAGSGKPQSKSAAARRAVTRPAPRLRGPAGPPARSKAALAVGVLGVLMLLGGVAIFVLHATDTTAPKRPALEQKRDELKKRIADVETAIGAEHKSQQAVQVALDAAARKAKDLAYNDEMIDPRFSAAAEGINVIGMLKELTAVKESRREVRNKLDREREKGDVTKVIARAEKTVVIIRTDKGSGSGFLLTATGLCATNYHVVEGARKLTVRIQKRDSRDQVELEGAHVVAANKDRDLALIQLPKAPDSVSQEDGYPNVVFRKDDPSAGEPVIAIGNPGLQSKILEYTVTQGIVSNARRMYGTIEMIQIDAGVNPGNSGGPLFDAAGFVLGVVSAKGIDVENVAFAIPVAALTELIEKRGDEDYRIENLADWERKNNPKLSATFADDALQAKYGTPLPEDCSRMALSDDGKILYLLFGHSGKIQEYLTAENRLGRTFDAGCQLAEFWVRKASGTIAALSATTKKLLFVNTQTMALDKTLALRALPALASFLGGSADYLVLTNPARGDTAESTLIAPSDTAGAAPEQIELPHNLFSLSSASNSKWAVFETFDTVNGSVALVAYPVDACMQQLKEWSSLRQKNSSMGQADVRAKVDALAQKLLPLERKFEVPGHRNDAERGPIFFLDADHIIMGRHAYKIGDKIEEATEYEENPTLKNDTLTDAQHRLYQDADTLRALGPAGKYAASRTHIYDAGTGKIIKKIPFLCSQPVFSKDGNTLFALDGTQHFLYRFTNWKGALDEPK